MGADEHCVERNELTIHDPIVLPSDVLLVPVVDLPPETREQIEHGPDDFALTRPQTRTMSSIVDRSTADLLERFREPKTIVAAIVDYARAERLDPETTLERAFPTLAGFLNSGVLVAADSALADPIEPTLAAGAVVDEFAIIEAVHVIDDTEVHLARARDGSLAALKVARPGSEHRLRTAFDHEAAVLAGLTGTVTPKLMGRGAADGREFLAVSWCQGIDLLEASAELRQTHDVAGLVQLATRVIGAYAQLHTEGVLHGDIHPRNGLVDADGRVWLIDFGLATRVDEPARAPRGGIDLFLEPELARARLDGRPAPSLSLHGEQYSLAALVYLLLTGAHTHSFSLEPEPMLRQLTDDPPLPFSAHGADGLGAVERTLTRALAKEPTARYPSTSAFLEAFAAAADMRQTRPRTTRSRAATRMLSDVVDRLRGPLLATELEPPTASVNLGAAGLAYGLLRIAAARDDIELLSLAERWSHRAMVAAGTDSGFENAELDIAAEAFGRASLFHSSVGVYCVEALIAHARGDEIAQALAVESFCDAARQPSAHLDVAFGTAGTLLGCALLLEAVPGADAVAAVGDELAASLSDTVHAHASIADGGEIRTLGAAHGWAGLLYALLRWSEARACAVGEDIAGRLHELETIGLPLGRGLRWARETGLPAAENPLAGAWCNGAAGHVHLWLAAERVLGESRFARLAEAAAWAAYEAPASGGDLCCGLAGRAYALLAVHRQLGDRAWLARARTLSERAPDAVRQLTLRRDSLYKGEVGIAVLAADLNRPEWAAMPLFEREGWR